MSKTAGKSTARQHPTESASATGDLRQFEQRLFHALIAHSADAITLIDTDGVIRYLSPSLTRVLGYAIEERMGRNLFELVHPDDLELANRLFAALLTTSGESVSAQLRYQHRDGSWRWLEGTATNLLADPLVGAIMINFRDVTARKQAEAGLAMFAAATFEGIVESEAGRIVDCNEQLAQMLGYSVAELKGMEIAGMIPPEARDRVMASIRQGREAVNEHALFRKDGTRIVVEVHGRPLFPGSLTRHSAIRDITERKQAEARLAMFAEATFEGIVASEAGRIVDCNEQFAQILGYSVAELKGMMITDLVAAPEDRDRVMANIRQGRELTIEHAVLRKDGTRIIVEAHGRPVAPGSLTRHTAFRDVTARKRAEARLVMFAEATFEGIVESEAGRIVDCNEQYARMAGYSVAELKGMEIAGLIAPEDRDRVMASIRQGREAVNEHAMLRKDGTRLIVEVHGWPLFPGSLTRHSAIRDITERKRAEAALQRAHDTLEQRVRTRTAELESANARLGREITRRGVLEKQVLEISEAEQRRIGQDLHDSICQQLAGLAMMCRGLEVDLKAAAPALAGRAAKIRNLIGRLVQEARDLARGLCPVELQANDLASALRYHAGSVATLFDVTCEVEAHDQVVLPDQTVAMQLYRIAQEAISNAVRHGQARRITLGLTPGVLTISDDGSGFPENPPVSAGLGLAIMHYRARLIGASLDISRVGPKGGTLVTCLFPAASQPAAKS